MLHTEQTTSRKIRRVLLDCSIVNCGVYCVLNEPIVAQSLNIPMAVNYC